MEEQITMQTIISFATVVITYIFGWLAKKYNWIESKYIPYQNAVIGILAGIIAYILGFVKDPATGVITCIIAAFGAGGGYDLVNKSNK